MCGWNLLLKCYSTCFFILGLSQWWHLFNLLTASRKLQGWNSMNVGPSVARSKWNWLVPRTSAWSLPSVLPATSEPNVNQSSINCQEATDMHEVNAESQAPIEPPRHVDQLDPAHWNFSVSRGPVVKGVWGGDWKINSLAFFHCFWMGIQHMSNLRDVRRTR